MAIKGILFDLDGTLLDTVPDLTHAMNVLLVKNGLSKVSRHELRPLVSKGSAHMVAHCFREQDFLDSRHLQLLSQEFVHIYAQNPVQYTTSFAGVEELITTLLLHHYRWGIVTNKLQHLAVSVLAQFPFCQSSNCVVGGDTLTKAKPHPDPLWHAAQLLDLNVNECIYVGDSAYDIAAGKNASMQTVLAKYGYINPEENPNSWGADFEINAPLDLLSILS